MKRESEKIGSKANRLRTVEEPFGGGGRKSLLQSTGEVCGLFVFDKGLQRGGGNTRAERS